MFCGFRLQAEGCSPAVTDEKNSSALPLLLLLVAAYERAPQGQSRSVRQLAPGVFTRVGDKDARQPANTSWVEFRNFVVVIEANTPWGIRAALPEIRKTTSKPIRYVFDTHYHWDHTQGNSVMADEGVTVVCSQDCASELAVKGKGEWDQMSKRTGEYSLAPYRMEQPSLVFGDFMAIDDGERRLELRRVGPAHTIGDAVAFLPKEGILFTGDLCVNWRFGNNVGDRDADHPHWVQVLNDLARWNVKTVVPGHGDARHGRHAAGPERLSRRPLEAGCRRQEGGQDGRPAAEGSEPFEARRFRRRRAAESSGDSRGAPTPGRQRLQEKSTRRRRYEVVLFIAAARASGGA